MAMDDEASFLLQAAIWQDSLLQTYRTLHLTFQSILLAIGIGLTVSIFSFNEPTLVIVSAVIFLSIWWLQLFSAARFKRIITTRGRDVNYWHREIILAENKISDPSGRQFTRFKISQQNFEKQPSLNDKFLTKGSMVTLEDTNSLIEQGLGHTRKVIDRQLFTFIRVIWFLLLAAVLFTVAQTILNATGFTF